MAITPGAGYTTDPNNANSVVPIGSISDPNNPTVGQQSPGGAFNSQTTPLPTTTNLPPPTQNSGVPNPNGQGNLPLGNPNATSLTPEQQMAQKYQSGLAVTQQSGQSAPQSQGDGSAQVNDTTSQITQSQQTPQVTPVSPVLQQLQNDPGYQKLMQDQQQYLSSQNQKETLTQQYTDLSNQLGLTGLNTELVNDKAVIDGTENDIRNEVTKAGGFATESQVQAMASARNKVLIQNYNNLLATRDNVNSQITTMMGLAKDDQANATSLAQEQMNFDQQIVGYEQKFTQNAQDALNSMQKTEGWDGIYKAAIASGDPNAINRINQTMGQGFDLATAAQNDFKTKQAQENLVKTQAQLVQTQANTSKIEAQTAELNLKNAELGGQPNPQMSNQPGFDAQGIKLTPDSGSKQILTQWNNQGAWDPSHPGLIPPQYYNQAKAWWLTNKIGTSADFDGIFGGYKSPPLDKQKLYN